MLRHAPNGRVPRERSARRRAEPKTALATQPQISPPRIRSAALAAGKDLRELLPERCAQLRTHVYHRWKFSFELTVVGDARVNQDAVIEIARQKHWVSAR